MKTEPLSWRKSSRSTGGNCVEIADVPFGVMVRDSKNPTGPILCFADDVWRKFLTYIKQQNFHL